MLPINPLAYATYAGTQSIRQSEEKSDQAKRAQEQEKDTSAADRYEHSVESTDMVQPIHDEDHRQQAKKSKYTKKPLKDDGSDDDSQTHLDLTA